MTDDRFSVWSLAHNNLPIHYARISAGTDRLKDKSSLLVLPSTGSIQQNPSEGLFHTENFTFFFYFYTYLLRNITPGLANNIRSIGRIADHWGAPLILRGF